MSKFESFVFIEATAYVECGNCGLIEQSDGESDKQASRHLDAALARSGWEVVDGVPLCGTCAKKNER